MSSGRRDTAAEKSLLLSRQILLNKLREKYGRFGDQVVQYLYESASQRGGLRRVVGKVVRPLPLEEDRMHEALVRFIATEGVETFFARVDPKRTRTVRGAEAADAEPVEGDVPTQVEVHPRRPVATGTWDGVERRSGWERRSGLERRSGKDRRTSVEVVFKNRRFGGDRRSGIERRSGRDRRRCPPPPYFSD